MTTIAYRQAVNRREAWSIGAIGWALLAGTTTGRAQVPARQARLS